MKYTILHLILIPIITVFQTNAQEFDCVVKVNTEKLSTEARENLIDFEQQITEYINNQRWTKEDFGDEKIKCTFDIFFQGTIRDNQYHAQISIVSQRPIYKQNRNSAILRILDERWEFSYIRNQILTRDNFRFDPLLSFIDFYIYLILGFDFDTYGNTNGSQYFQKAYEIANRARSSSVAGKGWEFALQGSYARGVLIDELLNSKFEDFREAVYLYHYKGLDLLYKDQNKAKKNILIALEKIGDLQAKLNQRSLIIKTFFDTKYLEIAELFRDHPDKTIYKKLAKIDPWHQNTYEEYSQKKR